MFNRHYFGSRAFENSVERSTDQIHRFAASINEARRLVRGDVSESLLCDVH